MARLVLGDGLRLAVIALAIGLGTALALTQLMSSLLYGVTTYDPVSFGAAVLVLTLVTLGASLLPALRAAAVDPTIALRHD
jgi:ABC-type antimicrobial peptide transport system permease subunit